MDKHALDPACLLGDRLQTLSRAELTALAEALCRILTERGTYHGGIRPDNISRAADGTVGLGAPARTDTKDWTTEELEFMAPEVFWSGTRDASADVYSLGLLLYAGVSGGRLPFYPDDRAPLPEDHAEALRRRMNGEPLPPARKAGRGLAEIIARAAQCKPDDRYATPAELCAALEQYDAEQRRNVPTAQEMFHKPEQELSEVERMMLAILTEEAAAPEPDAEPEPETPAEEPTAEETLAEVPAAEETSAAQPEPEAEPAAEPAPEKPEPEAAPEAEAEPKASKPEPQPEPAPEVKPEPEPETKPQPAPEQKPAQPLPNKFRPEKQPAQPETPAKPKPRPERKPEKPPVKKPEAYRPAPKKREPAEQRQSHKAGVLLTVLIICAAVLAVLLLRSLGVFGTPTTAETTPTPTVSVATPAPTETPTPTPTPKPEPTYEVVTADVSWADAEAAAEAKGGHLVVIDSAEKWTRVAQLADESGLTYVWIGLHRTDSGELAWVRDNVDPVYNWASGEPSVHDTNGAAEDYVLITRTSSGWYYNDCIGDPAGRYPQFYSGKIGYIIEIDP